MATAGPESTAGADVIADCINHRLGGSRKTFCSTQLELSCSYESAPYGISCAEWLLNEKEL